MADEDLSGSPELAVIEVSALAVRHVSIIGMSQMNFTASVGHLVEEGARLVLVPLVDLALSGSSAASENEPEVMFSTTLSLENLTFLMSDLASDLVGVCVGVGEISKGPVKLEPGRRSLIKGYLQAARERLQEAEDAL